MEKLLELIVGSIVQKPKKVKIEKEEKEDFLNLRLKVDQEDLKIVIGKGGRTIRAIRNLLKLRAIKEGIHFNLELQEN